MALPDNTASTVPVIADYIAPYDRPKGPLEDWEEGGIALNDGTQGLQVQMWYLSYNDDESSPNYGDFTVEAETTLESAVQLNVPNVTRVGLAFNQNMDPAIAYETKACEAKLWWYDATIPGYATLTLPAGSKYVACCLDDHRATQTGTSDIILGYIRNGTLYYRQERDRFLTERALSTVGGLGAAVLHRVGMTKNLRLKFDVREGPGVRLSEIESDICHLCDLAGNELKLEALYPVIVRGFNVGGVYSGADTLRTLMGVYFHDMVEVDGKIVAVPRGGETKDTVYRDDCVVGEEVNIETAREQGLEFPYKVHLAYACAETDYTPTKATAERISINIQSVSEVAVETAVNLTPEEAYQRAHIIQKILWAEYEGKAEFGLPENFASYIPSDCINLEIRTGVFRRVRLGRMLFGEGFFKIEGTFDRRSAYGSTAVGLIPPVPEPPAPTLPGDTTWEFMDLPALLTALDSTPGLHYYVAAHGDPNTAWHGAQLQRLVGPNYLKEADIPTAEKMGQLAATLLYGSRHVPDTTNTILVSLTTPPESITHAEILAGRGAWLVGDEILQVRDWVAEGLNWRGSYLLRGRLDTPIASPSAPSTTRVVFLGNPVVVPADVSLLDTTLTMRAPSYGQQGSAATPGNYVFTGRSQEEWAPVDLVATQDVPAAGDWTFTWVPRYRLGSSLNPIPSAYFYGWRLRFTIGATAITKTINDITPSYVYTSTAQSNDWGSAQSSFDDLEIVAMNHLGGEGKPLNEAVA